LIVSIAETQWCDSRAFKAATSSACVSHRNAEFANLNRHINLEGFIMNASKIAAVAALSLFAAMGAHADEADSSQFVVKFEGNRTRAEVQAEAAQVAKTRSTEPNGSRVLARVNSSVERDAVRAQAAEAVRLGKISSGEVGLI
jgi:hypothetical protein